MRIQWNQRLISSFLGYLDHVIQNEGEAFINTTGYFYPVSSPYQGLYAYSAPFRQMCSDVSIPSCSVLTGCYLNNTFVTVGTSGLSRINYPKGTLYFTGQLPFKPSGSYSYKECNIELTSDFEYDLLFNTQYVQNSHFNQNLSGLADKVKTTPAIFVKVKASENKPFAFQRIDDNVINLRLVVIADSEFQKQGLVNVIQNLNMREFLITTGNSALSYDGSYTGAKYNYTGQTFASGYWPLIKSSKIITVPFQGDYSNMTKTTAMCDLEISTVMVHP